MDHVAFSVWTPIGQRLGHVEDMTLKRSMKIEPAGT